MNMQSHTTNTNLITETVAMIASLEAIGGKISNLRCPISVTPVLMFELSVPSSIAIVDLLPASRISFGLKITNRSFSDHQLIGIEKCKGLSHLDISETNITDNGLPGISQLPNLVWLDISWTDVSTRGLRLLTHAGGLSSLFIRFTGNIDPMGLCTLESFHLLAQVDVSGHDICEDVVDALSRCSHLAFLTLSTSALTDDAWERLYTLRSLMYINCSGPEFTESQVACLNHLGSAEVHFFASEMSDNGMLQLGNLENLTTLDVSLRNVTDEGLKHISHLKVLKSLSAGATEITDFGMPELAKIQSLCALFLRGTAITDVGVRDITQLRQLSSLNLSHTMITDSGLRELQKLKGLRLLNVSQTLVTAAGVNEFRASLPNCRLKCTLPE